MISRRIVCDECGSDAEGIGIGRTDVVRGYLKQEGWQVALKGGKDYCPRCWAEMTRLGATETQDKESRAYQEGA